VSQSKKALVGACGGYCGGCTDYLAYINKDEKLKRKIAGEFSKQFDMDINPEDSGCLECHGSIHKPWCTSCSIRGCAEERGMLTCHFVTAFHVRNWQNIMRRINVGMNSERTFLGKKRYGLKSG